ncbi:MAG: polysaccharide deacetylase family protein [Hyphomicrobiales bacterium]|nr:polysaccharide deacetylase family protein [Hyphomicrobiales bacterium]
MSLKHGAIDLGFRMFGATGLHRAAARFTQGLGAILMFHRVRDAASGAFAPNRGLEIAPEFLDRLLARLREKFDIVDMDEALARIAGASASRPFVVLTFDDGYRDTADVALPILSRHEAPFTVYVATGFADRTARMWWVEMEEAIATLDRVRIEAGGLLFDLPAVTVAEKTSAFETLYWRLRAGDESELRRVAAELAAQARIDGADIVDELCLNWAGLRKLAGHPLATIGAHTLTHPMLAKHERDFARREIFESKAIVEREIGRAARHFAYPVGDPGSAGPREFALAREAGFASAVTTRPGMIFPDHADYLTALPRLSVNGNHQNLRSLDILLSGAPFMLMNRGRRLSVA